MLLEDDAPPTPTKTAAVFDVVVEAEVNKTAAALASDLSHVFTMGWSFLLEAPAANFSATAWTSLNKSATGHGLVGSVAPFRL